MSILQLIKGLAGKEDINWGDSSTTFGRETHTGGTVNISYVDAEAVPSTNLGGYIGDHLHLQMTDTSTTSATFNINALGTGVTLSTSGLTAGRTLTFPNTSNQALIGATDLAGTGAGVGASLIGIQDTGTYFGTATVEGALQEAGVSISSLNTSTHNSGMKNGFKLAYSTASAITISGGMWALNGATNRHVYTASQITFTLGSAGSNPLSTDLTAAANTIHYIYIDDTAVISAGSNLLTASAFINTTTAPAYSHIKIGWYSGNDRCIGAVLTDASFNILPFDVRGDNYYRYRDPNFTAEFALANAPVAYASLNMSSTIPAFSTRAQVRLLASNAAMWFYFDTTSSAVTPEAHTAGVSNEVMSFDISTDTSQVVYWYADDAHNVAIDTAGYYMDEL